jgi:Ca2+/Na+ antiporter
LLVHRLMNNPSNDQEYSWTSATIAIAGLAGLVLFYILGMFVQQAWVTIVLLLLQTVVIAIVIWQACDPFGDAAQWIGRQFNLPGSVRGATLDAISSSMPELFTGIFFVLVAVSASELSPEQMAEAGGEGFAATLATCAGSAIYNMILIPAICAIFISYYRPNRPRIDIEEQVISRDGLWFVGCEMVLIFFLFTNEMHWWMGVILLCIYFLYICILYHDARKFQSLIRIIKSRMTAGESLNDVTVDLKERGEKISRDLMNRFQEKEDVEEADDNRVDVAFGFFSFPLNMLTAWLVIAIATIIAACACYWLVEVTRQMADALNAPVFFVAVIIAAAASSVPDTFLSIGSARRGDDDGAVSNAFGSNIFDISVCLSIPLLVASYLNGWQGVPLTQGDAPMQGLFGLRVMLLSLTFITLLIMWHNRQLTRHKAFVLCGLYLVFVGYAVTGSLGWWG